LTHRFAAPHTFFGIFDRNGEKGEKVPKLWCKKGKKLPEKG
jgi:hypothetical protein